MGKIFSGIVVALVAYTLYAFISHMPLLPDLISLHGAGIDQQINLTLYISGVIFVTAQLGLAWIVFRRRSQGQKAIYLHGNNTLELIWTTLTAILFVSLNLAGQGVWAQMHLDPKPMGPGVVHVEVLGQQFKWTYRYPGPDGLFGKTDPQRIKDDAGEYAGLDPKDPNGEDDVANMATLVIPVDTPVVLHIRSRDVIHSFFVRELRVKQDAVPGLTIQIPFTATKEGVYDVMCAELCGAQHYNMKSVLKVVSAAEFADWLKKNAP